MNFEVYNYQCSPLSVEEGFFTSEAQAYRAEALQAMEEHLEIIDRMLTADKLDFTSLGFTLPVTFDPNTISVSFKCGQLMGTYSSYYIYSSIWDTNAGYLTYSDKYGMVAPFTYSEEDGTIAEFVDDGTWGTYTATAMRWEKFKAESPITANRVGYLLYWMYPYLQKIEE